MNINYLTVRQHDNVQMIVFSAPASFLWKVLSINKKDDDKDEGYQRTLSLSRAQQIQRYIEGKKSISPAIIISLDADKIQFQEESKTIIISETESEAGWVIDGQHRLRGAQLASVSGPDIELPVVAFIGLDIDKQIEQFVTINKEAKGVPTSLYYDLLKMLPTIKNPTEMAKEKSASIANTLRKSPDSVFSDRIVVVTAPKSGQISMNNFVRKVHPLLVENKGSFSIYSQLEFSTILENYFSALKIVFHNEFVNKNLFFKTVGFGAMVNCLQTVFSTSLAKYSAFRKEDCVELLRKCESFDFSGWSGGSGTAAENQAGKDFEAHFRVSVLEGGDNASTTVKLF